MSDLFCSSSYLKLLLIVVAVASAISNSQSQVDSSCASDQSSLTTTVANDGLTALKAAGYVLLSPTRWSSGDWLIAGGIVGGTAVAYSADNNVFNLMDRNRTALNDDLTKVAVEYGSGYFAIGLPAGMYIAGLVVRDDWIRETAVLMGTTVLLTSAVTTLGKVVIGRARPYTGLGRHEFKPLNARDDFVSFPSGHTTAAFALSAVLAARIRNPWASVGLYGMAAAAAVSRLYSHDHWLSDVVFSAAYTTAVAHSVVKWFECGNETEDHALDIAPSLNGVCVVWSF